MILYWTPWMKRVLVYVVCAVIYGAVVGVAAYKGIAIPKWVMALGAIGAAALAESWVKPRSKGKAATTTPPPATPCPVCGEPTSADPAGDLYCPHCGRFVS
jgi:hypothetical protein